MNYEKQQQEERKRRRRRSIIVCSVVGFLVVILCIVNFFFPVATWKYFVRLPNVSPRNAGELRVHYLDVGQGDATVIELPDGKSVLVDGGNSEKGTADKILRYLNALKIKKLHAIILTHPRSAGVLDKVLSIKGANYAYCPRIYNYSLTPEYAAFCMTLKKSSAKEIYVQLGKRLYAKGETPYTLTFLSPSQAENPNCEYDAVNGGDYSAQDLNDTSAVFLLEYAGVRMLFTGKASERIESKLMLADQTGAWRQDELKEVYLKADILKVSGNGTNTATDEAFLSYLGVKAAVISCGKDNLYGHPHEDLLTRLDDANISGYRTDLDGTVILTVSKDGNYEITNKR